MRLDTRFRYAVYGAFSVLFVTGTVWLLADSLKEKSDGEAWQQVATYMLMLHGGAAMVALMLLGALFPVHIYRAWRARRNRVSGVTMITLNATLIVTAFGLYYLGSETIRSWVSDVHIVAGLVLPILFLVHVLLGKRSA